MSACRSRTRRILIFATKRILSIDGVDKRIVFQGVHALFAASYDREWQEGEDRVSASCFHRKRY
ncbi:hypothetical protein ACT7DA_16525 [Bacillus pacificus]